MGSEEQGKEGWLPHGGSAVTALDQLSCLTCEGRHEGHGGQEGPGHACEGVLQTRVR